MLVLFLAVTAVGDLEIHQPARGIVRNINYDRRVAVHDNQDSRILVLWHDRDSSLPAKMKRAVLT